MTPAVHCIARQWRSCYFWMLYVENRGGDLTSGCCACKAVNVFQTDWGKNCQTHLFTQGWPQTYFKIRSLTCLSCTFSSKRLIISRWPFDRSGRRDHKKAVVLGARKFGFQNIFKSSHYVTRRCTAALECASTWARFNHPSHPRSCSALNAEGGRALLAETEWCW